MRMAKATEKDLDCATLVIGMIDDIERGSFPRKPDGEFDPSDPDYFDPDEGDDCKVFVERLLAVVGKREHGGSLNRVVFGMITAIGNEVFDPDKDHLDWHPDLVPAIEERQRRRKIEAATIQTAPVIEWRRRDGSRFNHDFSGYAPRLYDGNVEHGWVLAYKEGGGDITHAMIPPEPGMEPVLLNLEGRWCWRWVQFGKEASDG